MPCNRFPSAIYPRPQAAIPELHQPSTEADTKAMITPVQPELPIGESCPKHGPQARTLSTVPTGDWNSHGQELQDRYRDTVYRCNGTAKSPNCSWAWSVHIGVFVPAGLRPSSISYPSLYHLKRFNPRRWSRLHDRPEPNPSDQ